MTGDGPPNARGALPRAVSLPLGVVLRRRPGVTRWARWTWQPVAVHPGEGPPAWTLLREANGAADFHAGCVPLELHRADVEAYRISLAMNPPSVFVVLREDAAAPHGLAVHAVTASAYEAQDYMDSGEELVEPVAMPDGLVASVQEFVNAHYVETPFVKRQRDRTRTDLVEDGIGDRRIRQAADVYRVPAQQKPLPRKLP